VGFENSQVRYLDDSWWKYIAFSDPYSYLEVTS